MPLLLPLKNNGNTVPDAYILDFRGLLQVYYSYQHPIAFTSRDQFVVRDDYWNRRRGTRVNKHNPAITQDVAVKYGYVTDLVPTGAVVKGRDFFVRLQAEMSYHGLSFAAAGSADETAKPTGVRRRRVRL